MKSGWKINEVPPGHRVVRGDGFLTRTLHQWILPFAIFFILKKA